MKNKQLSIINNGSYSFTTDIKLINPDEWNNFVSGHPGGNIFQTPGMAELHSGIKGNIPVSLFCLDRTGQIAGVVSAIVIKGDGFVPGFFTCRAIVTGGPLIRRGSEEVIGYMMKRLVKILPREVIYLQVRNIVNTESISEGIISAGYRREEHLNYLVDLKGGRDNAWRSMHPTRRKQIRRSEKRGVTVVIHDHPGDEIIADCYDILDKVYRRARLPLAGIEFFHDAFKRWSPGGALKMITAHCDGRIIGFRFFLVFNGRIYDWYAGSDHNFNDRYPNDILPWKIMEWGIENGCVIFDFGGAGNPGEEYGVRDYKKKFGGVEVNFGRYIMVKKPFLYSLGKFIFKTVIRRAGR